MQCNCLRVSSKRKTFYWIINILRTLTSKPCCKHSNLLQTMQAGDWDAETCPHPHGSRGVVTITLLFSILNVLLLQNRQTYTSLGLILFLYSPCSVHSAATSLLWLLNTPSLGGRKKNEWSEKQWLVFQPAEITQGWHCWVSCLWCSLWKVSKSSWNIFFVCLKQQELYSE